MRFIVPTLAAAALVAVANAAPPLFVPSESVKRNNGGLTDANNLGAGANPSNAGLNTTFGLNPNSSAAVKNPTYRTFSAFDFNSIALALHQEYIEYDLFNQGVIRFNQADFARQNMTEEDVSLLRFMAQQEEGHATLLTNILGAKAPKICTYEYPPEAFQSVANYVDYNQRLTRWGESGVYGFLPNLDNRAVAQLLLQSITTEARQQMIFRQWTGIHPMPVWFEAGTPQTWAWTLLSRYIKSCPSSNQPLDWQIFPRLTVLNNPNASSIGLEAGGASIAGHNSSAFVISGEEIQFQYDLPGKTQGPYSQKTAKGAYAVGKAPKYAAWVSQLNLTYSPLYDVQNGSAKTKIPSGVVFPSGLVTGSQGNKELINGTMFVALTSDSPYLTPSNLSMINSYMAAGPEIFQSG